MSEPNSARPEEPSRVGQYELLGRIGAGAMATVYLARTVGVAGFTRIQALKVLHPHLCEDPEVVSMLMDEARIASRIQHPNVVSIVDLGESDGLFYIAMEYVEGIALDRMLAREPRFQPSSIIVPVAMDALLGLAASHELTGPDGRALALVHRDVTPGNLLIGTDGLTRITDFGTAKARARATKTLPGVIKGKVGYVAPEVARGDPVDHRADIFSMGVVLWNALTGEQLYDCDDISKNVAQLLSLEVPPPSTVGLKPPAIFDQPILTALARSPAERFPDARSMHEALEDALTVRGGLPSRRKIGEWVETSFAPLLRSRREAAGSDYEVDGEEEDDTMDFRVRASQPLKGYEVDVEIDVQDELERDLDGPASGRSSRSALFRIVLLFVVMLVIGVLSGMLAIRLMK